MPAPTSVSVIGLGYIGLPTAAILATNGVRVYGTDVNPTAVETINRGQVHIVEPDLAGYVARAVQNGYFSASTAVHPAEAYVIAVPTPFRPNKSADLSYVEAATGAVAEVLEPGALVILESTSPPGTTEQMAGWIAQVRPDLIAADGALSVLLAHCPERVLPGRVMTELVTNDRIVGGLTPEATARGIELYATFCQGEILATDAKTAEMAKLVENSFRDVNIAFANELSLVCDTLGIDVWRLIELANHHPRVNILQPGPGVGGHCLAVDPWFIVAADPAQTPLIRTAREVNDAKPDWVVAQAVQAAAGLDVPVVAALGLAFKPDIDDLRESPACKVAAGLADALPQGRLLAVEPHVRALPPGLASRPNVELTSLEDALAAADVVVLLVDHRAFADRPALRAGQHLIDTRGAWR